MSKRDALRAKTIGAQKKFSSRLVKIGEDEYEVRSPTVKERGQILDAAGIVEDGGKVKPDSAKLLVKAVMACTYVPGTDEKVYDAADEAGLEGQPPGGWFDELARVAVEMLNVDTSDAKKP